MARLNSIVCYRHRCGAQVAGNTQKPAAGNPVAGVSFWSGLSRRRSHHRSGAGHGENKRSLPDMLKCHGARMHQWRRRPALTCTRQGPESIAGVAALRLPRRAH